MTSALADVMLDDGELARRIGEGSDRDAEAELCRRFGPRIWAYGVRHLRRAEDAADLTQEVLAIVLEALRKNRVEQPDRIASFVLGTCQRVIAHGRRVGRRREELLEDYARELTEGVLPEPGTADHRRLYDCLGELAYRERRVLLMTFFEERTAEQIAGELLTSVGNIRVLRHRSLARLRACLDEGRRRPST